MTRIYYPSPITSKQPLALTAAAANHVARVLRMQEGDALTLFNGDGREYAATIQQIKRNNVTVNIVSAKVVSREPPVRIHLVQGLCRGEKMDWLIQKSVELGVATVTPVLTEFGNVKLPAERRAKKQTHWQNVAISACEQCGRNIIPTIHIAGSLAEYLTSADGGGVKLMCDPRGAVGLQAAISAEVADITVIVGPEGGFSEAEVDQLQQAGFQSVTLGPRVLRTETAPVAVLSALQVLVGDF